MTEQTNKQNKKKIIRSSTQKTEKVCSFRIMSSLALLLLFFFFGGGGGHHFVLMNNKLVRK